MASDRQERIKQLFEEAGQREPPERRAYLDEQCGQDAALRSAVESLLAASEGAGSFLQGPPRLSVPEAVSLASTLTSQFSESVRVIGRYRLLEKIGEGGMGEVWLAEQQEPVRRRVALKLIKAGMDTGQVMARFEAERQALALMDHPAIAKVFDAGATGEGRPYFAMEYVPGQPITRHCDERRLGIVERLELFVQVCEAVQHAHRKAVLHRDLKPSNVLVASQDGRSMPKIIDFGVAKAMSQPLTERTLYTGLGMLVGTPGYMSPEQADPTGQGVDTRTDVYSLGVMLYELLVGELPFDRQKLRQAGWEGLGRLLREEEPATPSRRLTTLPPAASSEASSRRQTEVPALRRRLSGDLDWITMKAIEAERERRYGSPSELAEDIRRHLRDEPVEAASPGAAYRMRKFVRRHRLGVAAAAVVTLVMAAGLVGTTVGLVRARRAESEARRQAQTSERVSGFLANLLASVDPERMGKTLVADLRQRVDKAERARGSSQAQVAATLASFDGALSGVNAVDLARQLVDDEILIPSSKVIDEEMSAEPLVAARLQSTMGSTYQSLGLFPSAESHYRKALETRRRLLGPEHPDALRTMFDLSRPLHLQARYAEAEKILREAFDVQRQVLGPDHPETLSSMSRICAAIHDQGRYQEAETFCRETLERRRRALGEDHPDTAITMRYVADTLSSLKRWAEAEETFRQALDRLRRALGPESREVLTAMGNLGNMYRRQGRLLEAERLIKEVLEVSYRVFGEDNQWTLMGKMGLGEVHYAQGRYEEAERLLEEVVAVRRTVLAEVHPWRVSSIILLANIYLAHRRYDAAEPLYVEILDLRRRTLGEGDPSTLTTKGQLGLVHLRQGRYDEGEQLLKEVVTAPREVLSEGHMWRVASMLNLGSAYIAQRRYGEAEPLYVEALDIRRRTLGEDDPNTLSVLGGLVKLHKDAGNPERGRPYMESLLAARRRAAEKPGADASSKNTIAWVLLTCEPSDLQDPQAALKFALEAVTQSDRKEPSILDTLALA